MRYGVLAIALGIGAGTILYFVCVAFENWKNDR